MNPRPFPLARGLLVIGCAVGSDWVLLADTPIGDMTGGVYLVLVCFALVFGVGDTALDGRSAPS